MGLPVLLKDVVEALEITDDFISHHLNRVSGEIVMVMQDEYDYTGVEGPTLEDVSSEEFVALPSKHDIHEWSIMERFAISQSNRNLREDLLDGIRGRGAFRHFKSIVARRGIREEWFAFRCDELREIAIEFLEENAIPYTRD